MKLTQKVVDQLDLPNGKRSHIFWDDAARGLGLRCQARKRTWVVRFRLPGGDKQRQITLAPVGAMPLKKARMAAGEFIAAARQGRDLNIERNEIAAKERLARKVEQDGRISALAEMYLADIEGRFKPVSFDAERRYLENHWASFHDKTADALTIRQIMSQLEEMAAKRGPIAANRAQAVLSRLFVWAMHRGHIDRNPMLGCKRVATEQSRSRVLSLSELGDIWRASLGLESYGSVLRLLALTGCRRAEVGGMRWQEIDLHTRLWTIPSDRVKNGLEHQVPLSNQAVAEVEEIERREGRDHLFGNRASTGFTAWAGGKQEIDKASGVRDWVVHDVRRSVVTHLVEMGTDALTVELVVNHQGGLRSGTAGVYNRSERLAQRAAALQGWADRLDEIVAGKTSNVVVLRTA